MPVAGSAAIFENGRLCREDDMVAVIASHRPNVPADRAGRPVPNRDSKDRHPPYFTQVGPHGPTHGGVGTSTSAPRDWTRVSKRQIRSSASGSGWTATASRRRPASPGTLERINASADLRGRVKLRMEDVFWAGCAPQGGRGVA